MMPFSSSESDKVPPLFFGKASVLGRKWYEKHADSRESLAISQQFKLSPFIGKLLASRSLTISSVADYLVPTLKQLMPDPSHLKDLDKGVDRLVKALVGEQKIAVFGDYDVDGATATALFKRYFQDINQNITIYIPQRLEEGYGPNIPALDQLKKEGHQLIIMVDCGTTAFDALRHAKEIGLDIIIIDHHISAPLLPDVTALINPNRIDESSPLTTLCAAGLSFIFLVALHRVLRGNGWFNERILEPDLKKYLDLVALGTVCDVMPLSGLNRAFVTHGLKILHRRSNLGLKALADIAGIEEAPSAYHLGFMLGPRINAGGRVGKANYGTRLLSTSDPLEAQQLARDLDIYNKERQQIELAVLEQASEEILQANLHQKPVILVKGLNWHGGVIGIVAGRLKERFQKPVCVVGFEGSKGKGSGRSVAGVNLGSAMHLACQKGLLVQGGGHAMAAGFTVTEEQYHPFYEFLCTHLAADIANIEPRLDIDATLSAAAATPQFVAEISYLEPFGNGNPTPKICLHRVKISGVERVGINHLRCFAYGEDGARVKVMAFRAYETDLGEHLLKCQGKLTSIAGTLKLDKWNGREGVTFILDDLMLV